MFMITSNQRYDDDMVFLYNFKNKTNAPHWRGHIRWALSRNKCINGHHLLREFQEVHIPQNLQQYYPLAQ